MSKKILITGVNGFVGENMYKFFSSDFQVFGVDIFKNNIVPDDKFFFWNDLQQIPELDTVVHLAGKVHDTKNTTEWSEYYNINVGLTKIIFQYFLKSSATKFIFFSSVKAVIDSIIEGQLTEEFIPNPMTPYGKSKLEAENYILNEIEIRRKKETKNIGDIKTKNVYILRPCMIHGPGNKGNLNLLYNLQKKHLPWPLGAFDNNRSFCSIGNILFVVKELANKSIESGTYLIADDEPLSTNGIIRLIEQVAGKRAIIWNISPELIKFIARTGDLLGLPLNIERLKKLTDSFIVSNQKIKKALNIEAMPIKSVDGMKITIESFIKKAV